MSGSKGGRPANAVPTVKWDVYLRSDLAAQIELLLLDPMREKVKYGARGKLIEQLLSEWLEKQKAAMRSVRELAEQDKGPGGTAA